MRIQKVFLIIFIIYCLGFLAHATYLKKTVYGDGIFYYSWVHSFVVDGDLKFQNDYAPFQAHQPVTSLGTPGNKYSIGPAMAWLPWFLWVHALVRATGFEFPYQLIVGLSGVFYTVTGLILLFGLLRKKFSEVASIAAIIAVAGATNLLFYGSIDSVNSHAVSFFAACLFLTFLFQSSRNWLLVGCALGLVGLMRTQDVILGLLVVPFIKPKEILRFLAGALIIFLPQLIAWQLLYGKFWVSPYINDIEGFYFLAPHILGVLFHPASGLLLWTPAVALGFYGLMKGNGKLPLTLMAIVILLQVYLVASWSIWWQGASYSGRMFVSVLPLVAFGLANFFAGLRTHRFGSLITYWIIIFPLCILNILFITFFLLITK